MIRLRDVLQLKYLFVGLFVLVGAVGFISYQTSEFVLLARLAFFLAVAFGVAGLFANYASEMF